jgi:hypothetical protein
MRHSPRVPNSMSPSRCESTQVALSSVVDAQPQQAEHVCHLRWLKASTRRLMCAHNRAAGELKLADALLC